MKRLNENMISAVEPEIYQLQHGITIRIWVTAASISSHNICICGLQSSVASKFIYFSESTSSNSFSLPLSLSFLQNLPRPSYLYAAKLLRLLTVYEKEATPFLSHTAMTMHIPLSCLIHGKVLHE